MHFLALESISSQMILGVSAIIIGASPMYHVVHQFFARACINRQSGWTSEPEQEVHEHGARHFCD